MKKVALLYGGKSFEHEVSISSFESIMEKIDLKKYQIYPIYINKEGVWYYDKEENKKIENVIATLKDMDIVFPMIHGADGEDGKVQSFLELFDIPYVGCDSKTSMLCMDKEYMKVIAQASGIPVLPYQVVTAKNKVEIKDYPVIVKPASGGSSIGIGVAHHKKELMKRYKEAFHYDSKLIVEKYAMVRELEVGILTVKNKIIKSSIGEILTHGNCYSYDKKYIHSLETTPKASISKDLEKRIYQFVDEIVRVFSLKGFARIDFFYEEESDIIYFNEVNTIPGFTKISMYPKMFEAIGISYSKLLSTIVESS